MMEFVFILNIKHNMNNNQIPLDLIIKEIQEELSESLDKAGFYYRVFSRSKSISSIKKKLAAKKDLYKANGKKLQDVIGIRFVFYFSEDVEIFAEHLRSLDKFIEESNSSKDLEKMPNTDLGSLCDKVFMPSRLNLIFRMDEKKTRELQNILREHKDDVEIRLIDNTYEIQLRTVLSEGWHEVEHDLRYKCKNDPWWEYCSEESRMLNGIYASLETSERALDHLFSQMAYKNYQKKDWQAMMRNHFRIKFVEDSLSPEIRDILTRNSRPAKVLLKYEKSKLSHLLFHANRTFPLLMDNVIHLINEMHGKEKDEELSRTASSGLIKRIEDVFFKDKEEIGT
ncbi:RelA/SpoT domain protein [Porphyromonas gingivalis F0570]|uniref:RelA/SpoT domain protein n=2 Tax=Porphyromonas gingivalis TaxID=837 RepID=A0A0E2LPB1_PORGN|nr:RelA/SpoT domain protein [Porphyromonas gingivalis F0570]